MPLIGNALASEIVDRFLTIRSDLVTRTLERSAPGKFVETFVQCLQQISTGTFDKKPSVDSYLNTKAEGNSALPDGLRFSGSRIARAMYTMRNKRSIAHNGDIDPNRFDLEFLHSGATWIVTELIRESKGISMTDAGRLIEMIQAKVSPIVEDIDGRRLVHADVGVKDQVLIILHSHYPDYVSFSQLSDGIVGHPARSIRSRISELKGAKALVSDKDKGFKLTQAGYGLATKILSKIVEKV